TTSMNTRVGASGLLTRPKPQHQSDRSARSAHNPFQGNARSRTTLSRPGTSAGALRASSDPSPSAPPSVPQQATRPSLRRAQNAPPHARSVARPGPTGATTPAGADDGAAASGGGLLVATAH